MTDLEIPLEAERKAHYRFFEILPGFLSWTLILLPLILSLINATLAVFFVLFYLLIFFTRGLGYALRAIGGYPTMKKHMKLDWPALGQDLDFGYAGHDHIDRPAWHHKNLALLSTRELDLRPRE